MIGRVTSYDIRRGVGQIEPDDGAAPVFVHVSEVERAGFSSIAAGDRLSFDLKTDRALGRRFAVNLVLA